MKFLKIIIGTIVLVSLLGGAGYFVMNAENIPFESVCNDINNEKYSKKLCKDIGKRARTTKNLRVLNDKDFGKIIGVAWRERGDKISAPRQKKQTL